MVSWQMADSFGREMFFITFTNLLFHYSAVKFWQKLGLKSYAALDCKTVCISAYSSMRKHIKRIQTNLHCCGTISPVLGFFKLLHHVDY